MKLTICIATMPSRKENLAALVDSLLTKQASCDYSGIELATFKHEKGLLTAWYNPDRDVEILAFETDPYDGSDETLSYGGKRNILMGKAGGAYVAFVDDDDELHPEYLPRILEAIEQGPDVVGFKVACYGYANGCKSPEIMEPADVSIRYNGWANDQNGFKYVRFPHHLAPTKREHAMAIGYRGHYGEDHDYSVRMQASGRLKTEVHIDEFLYIYKFNAKKKEGE